MKGYFNKPEATAACMTDDGWFKTGDVVMADHERWSRIVDRMKELIKYNGLQVAPAELDACATHRRRRHAVHRRASVTVQKVRQVEFVDAIPKSPSGKILRRVLVEQERARAATS